MCGEEHKIGACQKFLDKDVPSRWATAKRLRLCFRCLNAGHIGKTCQNSQPCGQYGCQKLHHMLLHRNDDRQFEIKSTYNSLNRPDDESCHSQFDTRHIDRNNSSSCRGISVTEGKDQTKEPSLLRPEALLSPRGFLSKEDCTGTNPCMKTNDISELKHWCKSKHRHVSVIRDRNRDLETGRNTIHLTDNKEVDKSRGAMEGNQVP